MHEGPMSHADMQTIKKVKAHGLKHHFQEKEKRASSAHRPVLAPLL